MHAEHTTGSRPSRRAFLRGAAAAGAALPLAALAGSPALAAPHASSRGSTWAAPRRAGGTAIVAVNASPTSWDLTKSDWVTWQGVNALYDTLLTLDDNDQIRPGLAVAWEVSSDGLTYSLKLREGVKFHDGTPFNAEAVKFNFERHMTRQDSRYFENFKHIDRIETPDDTTVRIFLKELRADFGYDLAWWGTIQLSPEAYQRLGDRFGSAPVGTGPFKFRAYEPDSHIDLVRNDDYWNGRAQLDGLRIRIIPDATIRRTEMQRGTIDIAYNVEIKDVQTLKNAGITVEQRTAPGSQFISLNTSGGPTAELAVRRAIAHAIDRDTIIQKELFNLAEKSLAGTPKSSPYYHDGFKLIEYDPDEAGRILDAAGWKLGSNGIRQRDGKPLFLNILSTDANNWGTYNQIIQEMLQAIGIDSKITSFEWGTHLDNWRENKGDWHLSYHSQGSMLHATTPIPAAWQPDAFWNICQIKRATEPDLVKAADELRAADKAWQATSDLSQRRDIARKVQQLYSENQLVVWLWHPPSLIGVSPRLKNYQLVYTGRIVWFPTAEVE